MADPGPNTVTSVNLPSREALRRLAVSESGFVFDPSSGHHFTVNDTGLVLLRLFQQEQDVTRVIDNLYSEYRVDKRELERDVLEFAGLIREFVSE